MMLAEQVCRPEFDSCNPQTERNGNISRLILNTKEYCSLKQLQISIVTKVLSTN